MEQDDFLRMEDEATQRWEDSIVNACPNCDAQMTILTNTCCYDYMFCPDCQKKYKRKKQTYII